MPELESDEWQLVPCGPYRWQADASRQVENFTDFGHFPWVHPGLLGDPSRPVVPDHTVRTEGHVLHYEIVRPEAPSTDDFPVFANEEREAPQRRSRYELHLPYTIVLRLGWGGREGMVYFFASQPLAPERCAGWVVIGRNYNLEQPDSVLQDFEDVIFEPGPADRGVAAAGDRALRPRRRAPPALRRGRRRVPARDARAGSRGLRCSGPA